MRGQTTFVMDGEKGLIKIWEICSQGSHRFEKYLNIQVCLEKSLKNKFALEVLEKHLKALHP